MLVPWRLKQYRVWREIITIVSDNVLVTYNCYNPRIRGPAIPLNPQPLWARYEIPGYMAVTIKIEGGTDDLPVRQLWLPEGWPDLEPRVGESVNPEHIPCDLWNADIFRGQIFNSHFPQEPTDPDGRWAFNPMVNFSIRIPHSRGPGHWVLASHFVLPGFLPKV